MTIDFLEGTINSNHQQVPEFYRSNLLNQLKDGESGFTDTDAVRMDLDGYLWIDVNFPIKTFEMSEIEDYVRILKIPEGYILDISQATGLFKDQNDPDNKTSFIPQESTSCNTDECYVDEYPIIALVSDDFERQQLQSILKNKYPEYVYQDMSVS